MRTVSSFYSDAQREWDRLSLPLGRIEFATTLNLIARRFKHGGAIADIGGGPGRYMIELLKRGYRVTLVDLSPENIELAAKKAAEAGLTPKNLIVGDARDLSALGGSRFDGVLALGPLYHVTERASRLDILKSIRTHLAPEGVLIAAYLNAWGIARSILSDAPGWFAKEVNLKSLANGETFAGASACSGFTECVWSTPNAARRELEDAGFTILEEAGAEGFAGGLAGPLEELATSDSEAFEKVVAFAVETSRMPQYRRAADHFLLAASVEPRR